MNLVRAQFLDRSGSQPIGCEARALPLGTLDLTVTDVATRLAGQGEVMLIEGASVEGRRSSIVAAGSVVRFVAHGRTARGTVAGGAAVPVACGRDPLAQLTALIDAIAGPGQELPALAGTMFGFIAYDAARCFERLPAGSPPAPTPDYSFFLPSWLVAVDDESGSAMALVHAFSAAGADASLAALVRELHAARRTPDDHGSGGARLVGVSMSRPEYEATVRRAQEYIADGEIFQVVLSLQRRLRVGASPLELYRRLTAVNPSPFQFCYQGPTFAAVGASPEPLLTVEDGRAAIRPLAGTRPRGSTGVADVAAEVDLRGSIKEAAEHRMLVDLARNDLGRVCTSGTVEVDELMIVERYSHVMHLVSNVSGELGSGVPLDRVIRAAFPAGTMTGAPKVRAMEIVDELEPTARGLYAGAVGLIGQDAAQLYVTIRSLVQVGHTAVVQAGAGIVHDSDPSDEYDECSAKLGAVLAALQPRPQEAP